MRPAIWVPLALALIARAEGQCELRRLSVPHPFSYDRFGSGVAISGDLAIVGAEGETGWGLVHVYDLRSGEDLFELSEGWSGSAFGYSVAADGGIAVVGMPYDWIGSGGAWAFDLRTGSVLASLDLFFTEEHFGDETGLDVDIDGHLAVIGSKSGGAFVWDLSTKATPRRLVAPGMNGGRVAIDGTTAMVADGDTIHLFDATTGVEIRTFSIPHIKDVDLEGGLALVGGKDKAFVVEAHSGKKLLTLLGPPSFGKRVAIEGTRGIVTSDQLARVFDLRTGELLFELRPSQTEEHSELGLSVALGPDHALVGAPGEVVDDLKQVGAVYEFAVADPIGHRYCDPAKPNSTGRRATLEASGRESAAANRLFLTAGSMPPGQHGAFLASRTQGFVPHPGGSQGNLCLGGAVLRLALPIQRVGPAGCFQVQADLEAIAVGLPHAIQAGETWSFQAWYRDVNPGPATNFTDAVAVRFD